MVAPLPLQIWDLAVRQRMRRLRGLSGEVLCHQFDGDKLVAAGGLDPRVLLFDQRTAFQIAEFQHGCEVRSLRPMVQARRLACQPVSHLDCRCSSLLVGPVRLLFPHANVPPHCPRRCTRFRWTPWGSGCFWAAGMGLSLSGAFAPTRCSCGLISTGENRGLGLCILACRLGCRGQLLLSIP